MQSPPFFGDFLVSHPLRFFGKEALSFCLPSFCHHIFPCDPSQQNGNLARCDPRDCHVFAFRFSLRAPMNKKSVLSCVSVCFYCFLQTTQSSEKCPPSPFLKSFRFRKNASFFFLFLVLFLQDVLGYVYPWYFRCGSFCHFHHECY